MVVFMKNNASEEEVEAVIKKLNAFGFDVHRSSGVSQTVLGAIGVSPGFDHRIFRGLSGVADVQRVTEPYKLASRVGRDTSTVVDVDGVKMGGTAITVIASITSLESILQLKQIEPKLRSSGVSLIQGTVLKPRTSFYDYHGVEEEHLMLMHQIVDECGFKLMLEVSTSDLAEKTANYASMLLVGARNMQNFGLLQVLGEINKPVLLERGFAATVEEWIMSAEYLMRAGNTNIILCERGIRTFEVATRYTLDLSAVSIAKSKSHLPVFVNPSQGVRLRDHVRPMASAAIAAGADGVVIHLQNESMNVTKSVSEALNLDQFTGLIEEVKQIGQIIGRT